MTAKIFKSIFLTAIVVFAASFAVFFFFTYDYYNDRLEEEITREAEVLKKGYDEAEDKDEYLLSLKIDGATVTLIERDGTVIFDTRLENGTALPSHIDREEVTRHAELTLAIYEEVRRLALHQWEHIIVKVDILLIEVLDAVDVQLDGVTVECRQKLLGDDLLVQYHIYLIAVHPLRHLTIACHHEVHLAYEGHIHLDATHKIAQRSPIAKALLEDWDIGMLFVVPLPMRIQTIYICNYYIHS